MCVQNMTNTITVVLFFVAKECFLTCLLGRVSKTWKIWYTEFFMTSMPHWTTHPCISKTSGGLLLFKELTERFSFGMSN